LPANALRTTVSCKSRCAWRALASAASSWARAWAICAVVAAICCLGGIDGRGVGRERRQRLIARAGQLSQPFAGFGAGGRERRIAL